MKTIKFFKSFKAISLIIICFGKINGQHIHALFYGNNKPNIIICNNGQVAGWGTTTTVLQGTMVINNFLGVPNSTNPIIVGGITNPVQVMISNSNAGPAYYVLRNDGKLYSWGNNNYGQLGNGIIGNLSTPSLLSTISNIKQIGINKSSIGNNGILLNNGNIHVIKNDHTLWSWGNNDFGELGLGTYGNFYTTPNQVNISNVKKVITSDGITVALKNDGTLWCWGINVFDSLGVTPTHTVFLKEINSAPKQIPTITNVADFDFINSTGSTDYFSLIVLFNNGKIGYFDHNVKKLKHIHPAVSPNHVYVSFSFNFELSYFFTTASGDVYTFGNQSFYQGTLAYTFDTIIKKMNFINNIKQIYTSNFVNGRVYLTKYDGTLLAMGSNSVFDVINGNPPMFHSPYQVQTYCNLMVNLNEANTEPENINIFPNPSGGMFVVHSELTDIRQYNFRLFDITGKENSISISYPEPGKAEINSEGLEPGIYFLEVKTPGKIARSKKIIITGK
jgi:alpha-tubulin suppressor-like RCC1 family protein